MSELALRLIEENKQDKNTSLDLSWCGLKEPPEALFECTWLQNLDLVVRIKGAKWESLLAKIRNELKKINQDG